MSGFSFMGIKTPKKKYIKGVNLTKNEATHPESESIRIIIIIATIVFTIP